MAAITWRNVDAPELRGSAQMMGLAGQSINAGFDKLGEVLTNQTKMDEANWNQVKDNNTQAFLSDIGKYRTPEEYQAAVQSGALDPSRFGAQINQAAVRGALDGRVAVLQNQATAANAFQDSQTNHAEAPIIDRIKAYDLAGKTEEANALRAANPGLHNQAALEQSRLAGDASAKARARAAIVDPLKQANELAQLGNDTTTIANTTRDLKEADVVKNFVSTAHNELIASEQGREQQLRKVAQVYGATIKDGVPDLSGLSPEKAKLMNDMLEAKGLLTSTSTTSAKEKLLATLSKQGLSPTALDAASKLADSTFRTGVALSAEDLAARDNKLALVDDKVKKATQSNIFYSDPATHSQDKIAVLNDVANKVTDGPDTQSRLRNKMSGWMDKGMEITDDQGKTVNVKIPPKVMAQALAAGADRNSWLVNTSDTQMKALIETMMTDPQYKDLRTEADYLHADGEAVSRSKIKKEYNNTSGTSNADVLSTRFTDTLKAKIAAYNAAKK